MRDDAALGAAFVIAALLLDTPASAAPLASGTSVVDAEAVTLRYEAPPPDCPTEAEFRAEVEKLTSKARFTQEPGARRVLIELSSKGRDVTGRLVSGDGKNESTRALTGKTCREVASALAIALALTLDPEALLGSARPSAPPTPQPPAAPPRPRSTTKAAPPSSRPFPAASGAPVAQRQVRVGLGLGLALESGWSPGMAPGAEVLALLAVGERLRGTLGLTRFITREVDNLRFGAWLVDGAVCYDAAVLGVVRPFASLGYELGVVRASGSGYPAVVEAERPWHAVSVGLGLRVETPRFFLQVGGSLVVPTSRQRYLVSDPLGKLDTLYETSRLGLKQETHLGVFL